MVVHPDVHRLRSLSALLPQRLSTAAFHEKVSGHTRSTARNKQRLLAGRPKLLLQLETPGRLMRKEYFGINSSRAAGACSGATIGKKSTGTATRAIRIDHRITDSTPRPGKTSRKCSGNIKNQRADMAQSIKSRWTSQTEGDQAIPSHPRPPAARLKSQCRRIFAYAPIPPSDEFTASRAFNSLRRIQTENAAR